MEQRLGESKTNGFHVINGTILHTSLLKVLLLLIEYGNLLLFEDVHQLIVCCGCVPSLRPQQCPIPDLGYRECMCHRSERPLSCLLVRGIYSHHRSIVTTTAFFPHWHYLIIQSLLGENVSWLSASVRTWTMKTGQHKNFLCGIEKCHRFHDAVSGVVHGSTSDLPRDWDGMGIGNGI